MPDMNLTVHELFSTHTVVEAQEAVRVRRKLIEEKKDELRMLVGERYRDVIETSDTIQEMRVLSQTILDSVHSLCDTSTKWEGSPKSSKSGRCFSHEVLSATAEFKYLLEIPDVVWNFMDAGDHLTVTLLLLLSRSVSAKLQLTDSLLSFGVSANVLANKIWSSLSHLESAVSHAIRRKLSSVPCTTQEASNSLGALFLLEKSNSEFLLDEYLQCRKKALGQILAGPEAISYPGQNRILTLSEWFLSVTRFLCVTLRSVECLFLNCENGAYHWMASVRRKLHELDEMDPFQSDLFDGGRHSKELTLRSAFRSLRNFLDIDVLLAPADSSPGDSSNATLLLKCFDTWWSDVIPSCRTSMERILADVSSLKMLIEIRLRCLCLIEKWMSIQHLEPTQLPSSTGCPIADWAVPSPNTEVNVLSTSGLDPHPLSSKSIDLWDGLFRDLFLSRISTLYEHSLDGILKEWTTEVLELMKTPTDDMVSDSQNTDDVNSAEFCSVPQSIWSDFSPDVLFGDRPLNTTHQTNGGGVLTPGKDVHDYQTSHANLVARLSHALRPHNTGFFVFSILAGQLTSVLNSIPSAESSCSSPTPPVHLVFFLQRLMSLFLIADPASSGSCIRPVTKFHPSLSSPKLYKITTRLNEKLIELVSLVSKDARQDWLPIWEYLLSSVNRFLKNVEKWVLAEAYSTAAADEESDDSTTRPSLKLSVASGLCLARACDLFVDLCPSIGAVVVAGTGVTASAQHLRQAYDTGLDENRSSGLLSCGSFSFSWSNVSGLRAAWSSSCRPLNRLSTQLVLDCLLNATVAHEHLDSFHNSLLNAFASITTNLDTQFQSVIGLLFDNDELGTCSKSLPPFSSIQLKTETETSENSCFAAVRIPSSVTLPLHQFLLTVVQNISQLVISAAPSFLSIRELSLGICSALFGTYKRVAEHIVLHREPDSLEFSSSRVADQDSFSPSTKTSSLQDFALQLIFDIYFILHLANWPPSTVDAVHLPASSEAKSGDESASLRKTATELLEQLQTAVDPFDWDFCHSQVLSAVSRSLRSTSHLYAFLLKPEPVGHSLAEESHASGADSPHSQYASFVPLISSQNTTFATLPISVARHIGAKQRKKHIT